MPLINIKGRTIILGEDGFLADPGSWDEEIARLLADHEGSGQLNEEHMEILHFIRRHWEKEGVPPSVRDICKVMHISLKDLHDLFPLGATKGAYRLAGVPKPEGCL
ncbi:MAG TPA: TusE/DsrC/DsvC family sulfur relay protein [Bacteroidales bacterium]|nr:TusE/DsrC/DsvC family sulfur relay protein [Bacteroidales bacterium]